MEDIRSLCPTPQNSLIDARHETRSAPEDWENWDSEHSDEEHNNVTIRDPEKDYGNDDEPPLLPATTGKTPLRSPEATPSRLKSRARQKAQNAQAGIRLVTDMTKLRRQQQQMQQQRNLQHQQQARPDDARTGRFVDLAALRALEGSPRRARPTNSNASTAQVDARTKKTGVAQSTLKPESIVTRAPDLSPNDGPIVIGISLPEDDLVGRTIDTPVEMYRNPGKPVANKHAEVPQPLRSVWSPDTDDGSPFSAGASVSRATSSVYSQADRNGPQSAASAPPVPALPSGYHGAPPDDSPIMPTAGRVDKRHDSLMLDDMYDDVNDTPITLFEEDGSPASYRRMTNTRAFHARSLATTIDTTQSGWWDHIQTPFSDHSAHPFSAKSNSPLTPASAKTPLSASSARATGNTVPAVPVMPAIYTMPSDPTTTRGTYAPARSVPSAQQALSAAQAVPVVLATPATPEKAAAEPSDQWWARSISMDEEKQGLPKTTEPTPLKKPGKSAKPSLGISTTVANYQAQRLPIIASSPWDAVQAQRSPTPQPASLVSIQRSDKATEAAVGATVSTSTTRSNVSGHVTQGHDRDREQGQRTPAEAPPPYEPPTRPEMAVRYRAVFPPGHPLRENFPSSPGPMSPGMAQTMTSQGAIHMSNVPLTPVGIRQAAAAAGTPLPSRPSGALIPGTTILASEAAAKVERKRRRHEKEDDAAWRLGNLWRGRGCLPQRGCVGRRKGRESRNRRRIICLSVVGGILLVILLVVVLVVTLTRKHKAASEPYSFWLNTTDFPPIPTGVTTVVGTDNTENVDGCVQPTTLWSCALPKEQQAANQPYGADSPSFVFDIQFDNDAARLWKVPDGVIPTPTTKGSLSATSAVAAAATSASATQQFDAGFTPQPAPPSFQEMWFLGNTTDGIVSDGKAGEPTPFYITFLTSVNATTAGSNEVALKHRRGRLDGRAVEKRANTASDSSSSSSATTRSSTRSRTSTATSTGTSTSTSASTSTSTSAVKGTPTTTAAATNTAFPAPLLNANGTGAPAVLHPLPIQQPLRLYDRGLPTEHYGFYTYFSKTIYAQSITAASEAQGAATLPSDGEGGSLEADANFVVTWLQTRFRVQIWTRMGNTTRVLGSDPGTPATNTTQPGTFPYPISIAEDLHGGDLAHKGVFARRVTAQQEIVLTDATTILDNLATGGTLINHGGTTAANPSFGGTDGGTGGCKCVWSNFVGLNGNTAD